MSGTLDRWLEEHGLNRYGDRPGTSYTGGTPLFDERTGQTEDREEHVRKKHPEAPPKSKPEEPERR
ncbi:MAG TPA: hypothetical protein VGK67_19495 [Myxococcales bacterium]|jgi:hypothetical protein